MRKIFKKNNLKTNNKHQNNNYKIKNLSSNNFKMKIKDFFNLSRINKLKLINNPNNNNNIRFKQKIYKTNKMIK